MTSPEPTLVTLTDCDELDRKIEMVRDGFGLLRGAVLSEEGLRLTHTVRRLYDSLSKLLVSCNEGVAYRSFHDPNYAEARSLVAQMQEGTDVE